MKVSEMLELAKAGYKPSEIKEMHELMKTAEPDDSQQTTEENQQEVEENLQEHEDNQQEVEENQQTNEKDLEIEKLKEQLKQAQKINRHTDNSDHDTQTEQEKLSELVRGFF